MTNLEVLEFPFNVNLNDSWQVAKPSGPFAGVRGQAAESQQVTLPHDAMLESVRTPDAPLGSASAYFPSGSWSYTRSVSIPADWKGQYLALEVDGAASKARVYVNGGLAATRPNGYSRFFVDLSDKLEFGADNDIRIEVRSHLDSRWYSGSGLYRGLRLIGSDSLRFAHDGKQIVTRHLTDDLASLDFCTEITNGSNQTRKARLTAIITDSSGNEVARESAPVTVPPFDTIKVRNALYVQKPQTWSPENPYLYDVSYLLAEDEKTLDTDKSKLGIRTVKLDPIHGFQLNGVETKLRGSCIHLDNGPLGMVSSIDVELRRVKKLKEAGFNAIRVSHDPAGQALLAACDIAGLMVINEAFDMWTREKSEHDYSQVFLDWWERDIEAMVRGSRNHASVIMYSIGNEILEIGLTSGATLNRSLAEAVRSFDSSRPVTNGIQTLFAIDLAKLLGASGGLNAFMGASGDSPSAEGIASGMNRIATSEYVSKAIEEVCSALDVTGYNYADARYLLDIEKYPNRVMMGSETFPTKIATNWDLVLNHPQIIGDFTWTGWDYLGEVGVGAPAYLEDGYTEGNFGREFPFLTAYCGDIDITGYRRPASYYREIVFGLRDEPFLTVHRPGRRGQTRVSQNAWQWSDSISSWSWSEFQGSPVTVDVYSPSEEIELLLNGVSLGRKPVGESQAHVVTFEVAYEPGELMAKAFTGGVEVSRTSLNSPSGVAQLKLSVEEPMAGLAEGAYVFVNIELADLDGEVFTDVRTQIDLNISGPGELAGFGSGAPSSTESFRSSSNQSFDGRALAIVRVTGTGEIEVQASSELGEAKVSIQAKG